MCIKWFGCVWLCVSVSVSVFLFWRGFINNVWGCSFYFCINVVTVDVLFWRQSRDLENSKSMNSNTTPVSATWMLVLSNVLLFPSIFFCARRAYMHETVILICVVIFNSMFYSCQTRDICFDLLGVPLRSLKWFVFKMVFWILLRSNFELTFLLPLQDFSCNDVSFSQHYIYILLGYSSTEV